MKNNTLKKISAVALAAVMAVTFAPVASLQAFADYAAGDTTKAVLVSGTGNSLIDGGYDTLAEVANKLASAGVQNATIKLNKAVFGVGDAGTSAVTGSALGLTTDPTNGVVVFTGGQSDKKMNITLDLGIATSWADANYALGIGHDVNLTVVDSDSSTTGVTVPKIYVGQLENKNGEEGWDKASLTVDMGDSNKVAGIEATFADVTMKSGEVTGDIAFRGGQDGTVNKGYKSVHYSIGQSSYTMDGGVVDGYILNADFQGNPGIKATTDVTVATKTTTVLTEGLGKVAINKGTFKKDPLGNTIANSKYNISLYDNDNSAAAKAKHAAVNDGVATFGYLTSVTDANNKQNASMIGDTPVAKIAVGTTNYYYAGQELIDSVILGLYDDLGHVGGTDFVTNKTYYFINDGTATVDGTYADGSDVRTNVKNANIVAVANDVKINKAPWGSIVYCLNRIAGPLVSPTKVTVTPAKGLSTLTEVSAKTKTAAYADTVTEVFVGDKTIIAATQENGLESIEDLDKYYKTLGGSAVFTNGGNTLQIKADDKNYVDPAYLNTAVVPNAKAIEVVEMNKNNTSNTGYKYALLGALDEGFGIVENTFTKTNAIALADVKGVAAKATVAADKKYTIVDSAAADELRYVAVTESRVVKSNGATDLTYDKAGADTAIKSVYGAYNATASKISKANVQQIGESDISETGANGILFINGVSGKTKVTSTDKTLPIAYTGADTIVGDRAAQIASTSSTGQNIIRAYKVAGKESYIPGEFKVNADETYVQGSVYLPEVPRDAQKSEFPGAMVVDKDAVKTWTNFIDGNNVGITKTPNITTNGFGVQMVSSVNVNVGGDTNAPRSVYRFRNTSNGEHLYTIQTSEINNLLKSDEWVLENANAFTVLPYNTTVAGAVQVRRYHNIKTNEFLYSTDVNGEQKALDADPNWVREGIAFCGLPTGQGYAVTRVTNTIFGGHVYSTSVKNEVTPLIESGKGYKVDGVVFNAVETPEKEK